MQDTLSQSHTKNHFLYVHKFYVFVILFYKIIFCKFNIHSKMLWDVLYKVKEWNKTIMQCKVTQMNQGGEMYVVDKFSFP